LITALGSAGILISFYMVKGMMEARREEKQSVLETTYV